MIAAELARVRSFLNPALSRRNRAHWSRTWLASPSSDPGRCPRIAWIETTPCCSNCASCGPESAKSKPSRPMPMSSSKMTGRPKPFWFRKSEHCQSFWITGVNPKLRQACNSVASENPNSIHTGVSCSHRRRLIPSSIVATAKASTRPDRAAERGSIPCP